MLTARGCYRRGCDHPPCREAHRAYMAERRRQRAYGRGHRLVAGDTTRAMLHAMHDRGLTWREVREHTGMSKRGVQLALRPGHRVWEATREQVRRAHMGVGR